MSPLKRAVYISLVLVSTLGSLMPAMAAAATAPNLKGGGQALEIAPPIIEVNANPGQSITAKLYLRDISTVPLVVTNQINDFVAKGDSGVPEILLNSSASDPYTLIGYITALPTLVLQPQQLKLLSVVINVPRDASPGGHYGVIRFTGTPPSLNGSSSGVALSASLGALVLLTVSGHLVQNLQTSSFSVSQNGGKPSSFFQSDPLTFTEVLKNTGNVHVIPTGIITLKDMFGHTVISLNINEQQGNILPSSNRKFSELLNSVDFTHKRLFGRYSATFHISYGSPAKTVTDSLTFWVIPIDLIIIWIIVLIGGFFLIRTLLKRYNQHIIEKAKKSLR